MENNDINSGLLKFASLPKGKSTLNLVIEEYTSDRIVILSPFLIDISLNKSGTSFKFDCKFKTTIELFCDRCLSAYGCNIDAEKSFFIGNVETNDVDEFDIREFKGEINIATFLEEEIVMDLPPQKICDEYCKGLCDACGVDLNNNDECKCN